MGTWGNGNFESDDALDMLSEWIGQIISKIREVFTYDSKDTFYDLYGDSGIVANVDILGTLFDHYGIYPDLEIEEVARWKKDYLATYDRITSEYVDSASVESAKKRRAVIEATFDRLESVLKSIVSKK